MYFSLAEEVRLCQTNPMMLPTSQAFAAVLTSTSVHLTKTQLRVCSLRAKKLMNFLTRFYLILSAQAQASSAQTQRLSLQKKSNLMLSEVTSRKSKLLHCGIDTLCCAASECKSFDFRDVTSDNIKFDFFCKLNRCVCAELACACADRIK